MGITADQAKSCKDLWNNVVAKDLQGHGNEIFLKFLTAHGDEKPKFKKFAAVANDALMGNAEFAKQSLAVMKALGGFIGVVDGGDGLKAATKAMAAQHKTMGVLKPNFAKMFPVIVDYIVSKAKGDKAAWTACLDTIGEAITSQQ